MTAKMNTACLALLLGLVAQRADSPIGKNIKGKLLRARLLSLAPHQQGLRGANRVY